VLTSAADVREAALRLGASGIPGLLVGGTADRLWDGELASSSGLRVIEADAADHALQVQGDDAQTRAILDEVTAAVVALAQGL
jgi:hypothetical protein